MAWWMAQAFLSTHLEKIIELLPRVTAPARKPLLM
jgi:hypothetical protein